MSDDQFWRIVVGGIVIGLLAVYRDQIAAFMHRIGYRDWRSK